MKCNTPINPETKCALYGDELEAALKDQNSPRCGQELSADDVFCSACGVKISQVFWRSCDGSKCGVATTEECGATDEANHKPDLVAEKMAKKGKK